MSARQDHIVVGLLADEGTPSRIAKALAKELPQVLQHRLGGDVAWEVKCRTESLPLDEHGGISLAEVAGKKRQLGWDIALLLTDLPRRAHTQPIVSDYSVDLGVALLSMPAIGAWKVRRRSRDIAVHLLGHLLTDRLGNNDNCNHAGDHFGPVRHISSDNEHIDQHLALDGARGRARLLAGMVRDNRPWHLIPHLASATAAAAGTAAYGVVTSNFWNMADALAPWRLGLINAMSVAAMVIWLLFYNHLWEKASQQTEQEKARLYNFSTVVTLTIGVVCMYVILYVIALVAAFVVIDGNYLRKQLGHASNVGSYATIAWLACSVGLVAGALGSSFESEEGIRKATYGKRERERQRNARKSNANDKGVPIDTGRQ